MTYLGIIIFPIAYIAFWLFVTGLISFFGWFWLEKKYPMEQSLIFEQERFGFQSVYINLFSKYNSAINVIIYKDGIYLRPFIIFAFLHKPVFIRWNEIKKHNFYKFFFADRIDLSLGGRKITISGRSSKAINEMLAKKEKNNHY